MPARPVHYLEASGLLACRGLTIADVAAPLPRAPEITIYVERTTCPTCIAALARRAS